MVDSFYLPKLWLFGVVIVDTFNNRCNRSIDHLCISDCVFIVLRTYTFAGKGHICLTEIIPLPVPSYILLVVINHFDSDFLFSRCKLITNI